MKHRHTAVCQCFTTKVRDVVSHGILLRETVSRQAERGFHDELICTAGYAAFGDGAFAKFEIACVKQRFAAPLDEGHRTPENMTGGQSGEVKCFVSISEFRSHAKSQNVFPTFSGQPGAHEQRCGLREQDFVVSADVITVSVADEHALAAALAFPGIEPEAELRQMNSRASELNFQRHDGIVMSRRRRVKRSRNELDFTRRLGLDCSAMPEKPLNECPRELRPLFTKGSEASQRENYEYAIDLFCQVLAREPGLIDVRRALRKAQAGKSAAGGSGFFKKVLSSAGSSPQMAKAQFALRSNPAEALALAEQVLGSDANNAMAHRVVVEAATALAMPQTAVMSLEILTHLSPKDKNVAIQLSRLLADTGDARRAEGLLAAFANSHPNDQEVSQALKDVSAKRTMSEGGYGALASGEGSYRDILHNEKEAVSLEQEKRVQKTEDVTGRLIEEYEARIKAEPKNLKLYRDLAELYTQKKQFDKALSYYAQIKASEMGGDASLDQAIAQTTVRKLDHHIEQLNPNADDHAEEVARLNAEKMVFQIGECQKRVEKFPTDLGIRFEMGQLYFQSGKIGEAIKEFQRSRDNPHRRIASMNLLAQCFAKRKMFDLAAENLQEAIKEKQVFDDEKKDLVYQLGVVLENMGKKPEAIEQFKLIYKLDASYRDVEARVDAFYAGQ